MKLDHLTDNSTAVRSITSACKAYFSTTAAPIIESTISAATTQQVYITNEDQQARLVKFFLFIDKYFTMIIKAFLPKRKVVGISSMNMKLVEKELTNPHRTNLNLITLSDNSTYKPEEEELNCQFFSESDSSQCRDKLSRP